MSASSALEANINTVLSEFDGRFLPSGSFNNSRPFIIAVDGRCASGKTTLAGLLAERLEKEYALSVNLFHMDDFFLRPEQRTEERYREPGGNVDRERFLSELLLPLIEGGDLCFRPFDCARMELAEPVCVRASQVAIIEGSYSCHDALYGKYDLRVFMSVEPEEQKRRILLRNGEEKLRLFIEKWIPLEELYFERCAVSERCEIKLNG